MKETRWEAEDPVHGAIGFLLTVDSLLFALTCWTKGEHGLDGSKGKTYQGPGVRRRSPLPKAALPLGVELCPPDKVCWESKSSTPQNVISHGETVFTEMLSRSVVSNSLQPHGLQPTRLLRPWDSPGKHTGVGCHFLWQPSYRDSQVKMRSAGWTLIQYDL